MEPLFWLFVGAIAGAATVAFWDRIKEWAKNVLGRLIYGINQLYEVLEGGFIYFIKERNEYFKQLEYFTTEKENKNNILKRIEKEPIKQSELPENLRNRVNNEEKLQVIEIKTQ